MREEGVLARRKPDAFFMRSKREAAKPEKLEGSYRRRLSSSVRA
jgi:hypothetical protein